MKKDESNNASEKILMSWLESSSKAARPSVSTTMTWMVSPSSVFPVMGEPHTHRPFVQAWIVDPTPNPYFLSKMIRLSK